jgi:hypothetical protein
LVTNFNPNLFSSPIGRIALTVLQSKPELPACRPYFNPNFTPPSRRARLAHGPSFPPPGPSPSNSTVPPYFNSNPLLPSAAISPGTPPEPQSNCCVPQSKTHRTRSQPAPYRKENPPYFNPRKILLTYGLLTIYISFNNHLTPCFNYINPGLLLLPVLCKNRVTIRRTVEWPRETN